MEVQLQYSKYPGQFCMILIKSICIKLFNAEGELAFLLGAIYGVKRILLEVETLAMHCFLCLIHSSIVW